MTRIYIEGHGYVNVKEGTTFPINISIQDVTEPTKTNSTYSKKVTIVGDKESSQTLGSAFDVNVSNQSFNVNRRVKCVVEQNDVQILRDAYFQLLSVKKFAATQPNADDMVMYEGVVRESMTSLFDKVKDAELTDLSMFDPDQYEVLNKANVKARYALTYTNQWKYLLTGVGSTGSNITVKQFRPSIFARTYWDAIHNEAGYTWEMDEADDDSIPFNKLIIPYNGDYQTEQSTKDKASVYGVDSGTNTYIFDKTFGGFTLNFSGVPQNFPLIERFSTPARFQNNNITIDNFSQWDNINDQLTAQFTSNYLFKITVDFDLEFENYFVADTLQLWGGGAGNVLDIELMLDVKLIGGAGGLSTSNPITLSLPEGTTYAPGTHIVVSGQFDFNINRLVNATQIARIEPRMSFALNDPNLSGLYFRNLTTGNNADIGIKFICNETIFDIVPDLEYNVGRPIYIDDFVPKDIKQRDFVKGIMDMFKMVVEPDPENEFNLIYKTRNKYYDDGATKDWTDKYAKDKQTMLEWIQDKQSKRLKLTYDKDGDTWNNTYQDAIKETFGQYRYTFENEYNQGEEELKLVFSPTPTIFSEDTRNLFIPAIGSMTTEAKQMNIRILLDNGVRTDGNFNFLNDNGAGVTAETDYPFGAHWDDPNNPSIDINFGVSRFYYYQNYVITYNNLYTLYHQRFVGQLTKGKMLTAYFHLTPTDIMNFKRSDKIWVKDAMYNVNKIIDYDANSNGLTKVELITVDEGVDMAISGVPRPPAKPNPGNPIIADPYTEDYQSETTAMNTYGGNNGETRVAGQNNTIQRGVQGSTIYGNGNSVNRSGSIIIGDNNTDPYGNTLMIGDDLESDGYNKMLVSQGKINNLTVERIRVGNEPFTKTKYYDMGAWDMDSNSNTIVSHGLTTAQFENIRHVSVVLYNDALTTMYDAGAAHNFSNELDYNVNAIRVTVSRSTGGFFDSTSFNDSSINRGYVMITYVDE